MHLSRGQLPSLVLVLAGCGLQPYSLTSDTGTASTTADATLTTSPPSTTTEPTSGLDTTTGGHVPGMWRGVLQYHYVEEFSLTPLTFADCASGQRWLVSGDLLPGGCGAVSFNDGLYVELTGQLIPRDSQELPFELTNIEYLASPCLAWTCEAGGSQCGPWEDICGEYRGCDTWAQDCPEGQKCALYSGNGGSALNSTKCVPVMPGADGAGEPCTAEGNGLSGVDSCAKGHICWNVDYDTGIGTCVEQCSGEPRDPICNHPWTTCTIAAGGILALCLPGCDPLTQDCPGGDLCLPKPMGDGFVCVLDASGDGGQLFDPCEYSNACDPGLLCAKPALAVECDPMAAGCCLPFCDLSSPTCTAEGAECVPWYGPGRAPPLLGDVGLCALPP
jgi:hypothetical protein